MHSYKTSFLKGQVRLWAFQNQVGPTEEERIFTNDGLLKRNKMAIGLQILRCSYTFRVASLQRTQVCSTTYVLDRVTSWIVQSLCQK